MQHDFVPQRVALLMIKLSYLLLDNYIHVYSNILKEFFAHLSEIKGN